MNDGELDDLIRRAAMAEPLDSERLERKVRRGMNRARWPWVLGVGVAAAAAFLALRSPGIPAEYRDAARDHQLEVVEHRPRHWKTDPTDLEAVAAQNPLTVPAGYRLKEAKRCGIGGHPVTHLVYTDGSRDVSVYVTGAVPSGETEIGGQQVQTFRTGHLSGILVGPPAECRQFADVIQRST